MTRVQSLLLGLGVFALGGVGYWAFSAAGSEEVSAVLPLSCPIPGGGRLGRAVNLIPCVTGKNVFMSSGVSTRWLRTPRTEEQLQRNSTP